MDNTSVIQWLTKYLRFANYLSVSQLYLRDNYLLEQELKPEHIKRRVLGHWGTVPGINFIWAGLNYLVAKNNQKTLLVVGPGHGYPAIQSNLFIDGTLGEFYPNYNHFAQDKQARKQSYANLIHDFSWPGGFPSHSNPGTPGAILEGGELGYSLSTSFGAAFDNPDLLVTCIVGDGEAETGPLATSWHSNKFLNPITSGAVLPILHLNGYKISGPTLLSSIPEDDLMKLFVGYGWDPIYVGGDFLFEPMLAALDGAYAKIKQIQNDARSSKNPGQPRWPMIILRSPKGWFGPDSIDPAKPIVNSNRSHGIPLEHVLEDEKEFKLLKAWLESYKIHELVNPDFSLNEDILEFVPEGEMRIGMNQNARGESTCDLILPDSTKLENKFETPGKHEAIPAQSMAEYLKEVFELNASNRNFRLFSPDESDSNRLTKIFEATNRAYLYPVKTYDEHLSPDGRVMEILSEHTLEGWFQGYTLTGRHGILVTYEAFAEIISSMVDQYVKFIRHARNVKWRVPTPSINIVLTSVIWRQDHNGLSHQNPSFISSVLNNYSDSVNVYFPTDANSMLAVMDECLASRQRVNVIVGDKRPIPLWLNLEMARKQLSEGVMEWNFVSDPNPDLILIGCGDHIMREIVAARSVAKSLAPDLRIKIVNITELSCFGIGIGKQQCKVNARELDEILGDNKPIFFGYHGYAEDIRSLIFGHPDATRFTIRGYSECGTTTTPFDMLVQNGLDRFSIAKSILELANQNNKVSNFEDSIKVLDGILLKHMEYIVQNGEDIPESTMDVIAK